MQTLTIQSNQITLPVEMFEMIKGKKVEFIEYNKGVFIKPLIDFAEKSMNVSEIRQSKQVHGDTDALTNRSVMEEDELFREIAVLLYQKDKMTLGQASRLARMSQMQFQRLIAERQIPVHYDIADFESDIKTLQDIGRL